MGHFACRPRFRLPRLPLSVSLRIKGQNHTKPHATPKPNKSSYSEVSSCNRNERKALPPRTEEVLDMPQAAQLDLQLHGWYQTFLLRD